MKARTAVVLAAFAVAMPAARAGEGPAKPKALSARDVAGLYLAEEFDERARAEEVLDAATPEFVRDVLREVRAQAVEFGILSAGKPPPGAADQGLGVEVEFRALSMPPEILAALVPGGDRATGASRLRIVDATEVARLIDAVRRDPAVYQSGLAKATTLEGLACSCGAANRVSFVKSYDLDDVEIAQDEAIPDPAPVVGTFPEGYDVVVTPSIVGHGSAITMAVKTRLRRALRPIAEEPLDLYPACKMQVPELSESRWSRTVTVPAGKSALVFAPEGYASKPGLRLFFLLTPAVVTIPRGVSPVPPRVPEAGSAPGAPK